VPRRRPGFPSPFEFVREHLLTAGENYVAAICTAYNHRLQAIGHRRCNYKTFGGYIWILKRLGLVEFARREHTDRYLATGGRTDIERGNLYTLDYDESLSEPTLISGGLRRFYRLVPGSENLPVWDNPRAAYNGLLGETPLF